MQTSKTHPRKYDEINCIVINLTVNSTSIKMNKIFSQIRAHNYKMSINIRQAQLATPSCYFGDNRDTVTWMLACNVSISDYWGIFGSLDQFSQTA